MLLVACFALLGLPEARASGVGSLSYVGAIPWGIARTATAQVVPIIDAELGRVFMPVFDNDGAYRSVRVFDIEARRAIAQITVPASAPQGLNVNKVAVDPGHHRIFFREQEPASGFSCQLARGSHVLVLHTDSLKWSVLPAQCSTLTGGNLQVEGLWYDAASDKLYMHAWDSTGRAQTGVFGSVPGTEYIRRVSPDTGAPDPGWEEVGINPPCRSFRNDFPHAQSLVARVGDDLYVFCLSDTTGLVRIPIRDDRPDVDQLSFAPLVGPVAPIVDAAGARLMLTTFLASSNGTGAFVVNAPTGLFTGVVSTGPTSLENEVRGVGFDDVRGRIYLRSQNTLILSDIRHDPLPAGLAFSELGDRTDIRHITDQLGVDPLRRLLLLPDWDGERFLIYRDEVPLSEAVPEPDPDRGTADIPEVPGKTASTYSGSGNAFGAMVLSVSGPARLVDNKSGVCPPRDPQQPPSPLCLEPHQIVGNGDRVWYAARVSDLSLTDSGASTRAAVFDVTDLATKQDLQKEGIAGATQAAAQAGSWPVHDATCADFGSSAGTEDASESSFGQVAAGCNARGASVGSEAILEAGRELAEFPLRVSVGRAESTVRGIRRTAEGLVIEADAATYGIVISSGGPGSPSVSIGSVELHARAVAHGRSGTARATFTRTIAGVKAPGFECATQCDPATVVAAVNKAFGPSIRATLPEPELSATPRGYQSVVTKKAAERVSDAVINDDPSDALAGLVLTYYADGRRGRSRQIVKLAGVHVESHYGIYPLPQPEAVPPVIPSVLGGGDPKALPPVYVYRERTVSKPPSILQIIPQVPRMVRRVWRLMISEPRTAGLLAAALSFLLAPAYLDLRRRALLRGLRSGP